MRYNFMNPHRFPFTLLDKEIIMFSIDEKFIETALDLLEKAGLKPKDHGGYIKCSCPDCNKKECYCYPVAGYYSMMICSHKNSCGFKKSLKEYLNLTFPGINLYKQEEEYFKKHGLDMTALMNSGILEKSEPKIYMRKVDNKEYRMYLKHVVLEKEGKQVEKFRWFHDAGWKDEMGEFMPVMTGFKNDTLYVMEGIWNWMLALTFGLPCTCSLFGASYVPKHEMGWKIFFPYKHVNICYDVDRAGVEGSLKLALYLLEKFPDKKISLIKLPFNMDEPYKDFCEWIVDCKHTINQFENIDPVAVDPKETKAEKDRQKAMARAQQAEITKPAFNNVIKRIKDHTNNIEYIVADKGIYIEQHVNQAGQEFTVFNKICDDPVVIESRLDDIFTHDSYVKLVWGNRTEIVPYNWLWIKYMESLSTKGLRINAANAKLMSTYFLASLGERDEVIDVATKNGWCDMSVEGNGVNGAFVVGDRIIKYSKNDPIIEEISRVSQIDISKSGDKDRWIKIVKDMAKDPQVQIVLAAGTAAPLIKLLNSDNFVIHVFGCSSTGKSLSQKAAASMWGNHQLMIHEWKATQTGHELYFEEMQNLPCFLQDSQELIDDSILSTVCYMFANGQGKGRGMAVSGGAVKMAAHKYWKSILISSGEKRITEVSTQGGLARRVIELYRDVEIDKNHTRFLEINEALNNNYGHGAEPIIDYIIHNRDDIPGMHKENVAYLSGFLHDSITTPIQAAHVPYWALIWIGLQMNQELFGIDYNEEMLINQIQLSMGAVNKNPTDNLYNTIIEIFVSNKNKFSVRTKNRVSGGCVTEPSRENENWGLFHQDRNVVYFFPKILKRELKKYSFAWSMLEFLRKEKRIDICSSTNRFEQKISIDGIKVSVVGFPLEVNSKPGDAMYDEDS